MNTVSQSQLGKTTAYVEHYDATLLFPIPRQEKRSELGVSDGALPFAGHDEWNAYEISWVNAKGKPHVALGRFSVPANTPNLIESKSLKLYLNSLNQTVFDSIGEVQNCIAKDLSLAAGGSVQVTLTSLSGMFRREISALPGLLLDDLDLACDSYQPDPRLLSTSEGVVQETLHSHLLKSNCLVTGQPDWASVVVQYEGTPIRHEGLLRYLVSFRQHNEFHEQCVERIFTDIWSRCHPSKLSVWARYTRRGGLDINPWRTSHAGFGQPNGSGDVRQ